MKLITPAIASEPYSAEAPSPQHLDLVEGGERNAAQVDRIAGIGIIGQPLAIDEHQGAAIAQAAQVGVRAASGKRAYG